MTPVRGTGRNALGARSAEFSDIAVAHATTKGRGFSLASFCYELFRLALARSSHARAGVGGFTLVGIGAVVAAADGHVFTRARLRLLAAGSPTIGRAALGAVGAVQPFRAITGHAARTA